MSNKKYTNSMTSNRIKGSITIMHKIIKSFYFTFLYFSKGENWTTENGSNLYQPRSTNQQSNKSNKYLQPAGIKSTKNNVNNKKDEIYDATTDSMVPITAPLSAKHQLTKNSTVVPSHSPEHSVDEASTSSANESESDEIQEAVSAAANSGSSEMITSPQQQPMHYHQQISNSAYTTELSCNTSGVYGGSFDYDYNNNVIHPSHSLMTQQQQGSPYYIYQSPYNTTPSTAYYYQTYTPYIYATETQQQQSSAYPTMIGSPCQSQPTPSMLAASYQTPPSQASHQLYITPTPMLTSPNDHSSSSTEASTTSNTNTPNSGYDSATTVASVDSAASGVTSSSGCSSPPRTSFNSLTGAQNVTSSSSSSSSMPSSSSYYANQQYVYYQTPTPASAYMSPPPPQAIYQSPIPATTSPYIMYPPPMNTMMSPTCQTTPITSMQHVPM